LQAGEASFVTGNIMRHVVVMAGTGAIGLMAVFAVDLLNLFYISLLGQRPIAAAVGFAGVIGFFQTSVLIGLTIGTSAVVARSIGAGAARAARHLAGSALVLMVLTGLIVGLATVALLGPILDLLGAIGETRSLAETFLRISSPSLPLLAVGMGCSGLLRCIGDARRAMNVTLFAAVATAAVDPILIFGLHLGLPGAAISTVVSRIVLATLGWMGAALRHKLVASPSSRAVTGDFGAIFHVAGPALLTNLATPVGAAYVTRSMAFFGPDAVAGQATIDRISPVAFGLVYALSGAVGPILAQNAGAGRLDRVRETLRDSSILVLATVLLAWAALALTRLRGFASLMHRFQPRSL
jgi:Na+-driven multidrug efflux pump